MLFFPRFGFQKKLSLNNNFQVYKASAGSGKTSRMVQEYLTLALSNKNPAYFKSILGITFTNKAANELKERIIDTLKAIVELDESEFKKKYFIAPLLSAIDIKPTELKRRASETLSQMLHHYSELSISTIDSFMHRLVRAFTRDLKLPANFIVELDSNAILDEAIEELISKIGTDQLITEAMEDFVISRLDEERSFIIENEIKKMAHQLLNDVSSDFIKKLEAIEQQQFVKARTLLKKETADFENSLEAFSLSMIKIMESFGLEVDDFSYKKSGVAGFFTTLNKRIKEKGLIEPGKRVYDALANNSWAAAKADVSLSDRISNAREQIQPKLEEALVYIEKHQDTYIIQNLILSDLHSLSLLNDLQKIIAEMRNESGKVHISEFNKRVLSIVASEEVPFIYERLGERYNHILIDEFQDTSVSQWRNLMPLVENALSKGYRNMIVGDGKQAIYRWRGGFAEQFTAMPELKPDIDDALLRQRFAALQQSYEHQSLDVNRRSCKEIVEFNNQLFHRLKYHPEYLEAIGDIYDGLTQKPDENKAGGLVQIDFVLFEKGKNNEFRENVIDKTIQLINTLTKEHHYQYSDIALLTRGNRDGSELAAALIEHKIPVISSEALLINNSPDVQFLLSWFKLLYNAKDETAILVILSYLMKHALLPMNLGAVYLLQKVKTERSLLALLSQNGFEINAKQIKQLSMIEMSEVLSNIFHISAHDNPFVRFFLEHIWQRTVKEGNDLYSFLHWWDEKKTSLSIITPSEADAVKVMTMHKSKGLQFPVVIIPFASDTEKHGELFWIDAQKETYGLLPVALAKYSSKLQHTRLSDEYNAENHRKTQDAVNLLYVALTRPEDALYIFTSSGNTRNKWENMLRVAVDEVKADEAQGVYQFGAASPKGRNPSAQKSKANDDQFFQSLPMFQSNGWRNRISISKEAIKYVDAEKNEARISGNLIHSILEKLNHTSELEEIIADYCIQGIIKAEESSDILKRLQMLIHHPELKSLFDTPLEIKNEQDIIFPDGSVKRPDRIVRTQQGWFVVDFKTGLKNQVHREQVLHYRTAIETLVKAPVKAMIVYIGDKVEIEEVG